MCLISKKKILKIHQAFDELGYEKNDNLSIDDFYRQAIFSLNRSKDLEDAINVVRMFQFCYKNWKKIEKIFSKYKYINKRKQIPFEGSSYINYVDEEKDAYGIYYITNGLENKYKNLKLTSINFNDDLYFFENKGSKFYIYSDDYDYYIKYSSMSSSKMKLFDSDDNFLGNIVLSEDNAIFLEKNKTNYELVPYDDGTTGIFEKKYYDSLKDDEDIDPDKMIALIEWDILDKKSDLGVASLAVFEDIDINEIELFSLFAASTFLIFKRYISSARSLNYITTSNMWLRH